LLYTPQSVGRTTSLRSSLGEELRALLCSNRFALSGAMLLAVVLPEIFHAKLAATFRWAQYTQFADVDQPEIIATVVALLIAHFSLQKINALPLVGDKIAIFPAFVITFAIMAAVIGLSLREFGRFHLIASFVIGMAWYYVLAMVRTRISQPRMAVVGGLPIGDELRASKIDWVTLDLPRLPQDVAGIAFDKTLQLDTKFERLFARAVLRQIPVYELGALREMLTGRVQLHLRPEEEFGAINPSRPYRRVKRYFDLFLAFALLPFIAPVIGLFALAIRLESPGAAIFRQERIGYKGRKFVCLKLRSMRSDVTGADYTTQDDPRITPVGRFIRRTRIDELPQIFNIIRGEMCWIGPRPEALRLARLYEREIAYYGYRHLVRPGISGWAAVHQGNVALPDAAMRKLEYDFYYIKHFSLWLDFLIVLMTFRTIVTGFGAK
jgi:lipopolysaccharide/colanic/teichoic acid biosynthesis glycosyltransferase